MGDEVVAGRGDGGKDSNHVSPLEQNIIMLSTVVEGIFVVDGSQGAQEFRRQALRRTNKNPGLNPTPMIGLAAISKRKFGGFFSDS
jgi:hypothetical protein